MAVNLSRQPSRKGWFRSARDPFAVEWPGSTGCRPIPSTAGRRQNTAVHLFDAGASGKAHRDTHFAIDQVEERFDAALAAGGQRVNPGSPQQNTVCAESEHPQNIEPCPDTGIRQYRQIAADSFRDRWKRSEEHTPELQSLIRNSYAVLC